MRERVRRSAVSLGAAYLLLFWLLQACAAPSQGSGGAPTNLADTLADAASGTGDAASSTGDAAQDLGPEAISDLGADAAADVVDAQAADLDAAVAGTDVQAPPEVSGEVADSTSADVASIDSVDSSSAPDTSKPSQQTWTLAEAQAALQADAPTQLQALLQAYDMPICAAGTCLFLVQQATAKSVEVVGDWGEWTQANALQPLTKAPGWHSGQVAIDHSKIREYKVKLDGNWALDPSNPHFRFGGFGPNSAIYPLGQSRLRRVAAVNSPQLNNSRDLYVQLPAAYFSSPNQHFPVVYWHDGFNVFANPKAPFGDWKLDQTADQLIAQGAVAPFIQVGVDTDDRMSEYAWGTLQVGATAYPPKMINYAKFLVETVKPLIDKSFRTLPDRDHTALGGSSLGGNASLWIGWHYWQVFGRIASFSGALWVGEGASSGVGTSGSGLPMREIIAQNTTGVPKGGLRIYMDSGDRDFDDNACYECDSWVYSDWTRNALITLGWANRPEWDTDANLASAPANLPPTTAVTQVKAIAWSPQPPSGQTWAQWLGLQNNLLSLVGHGHQHSEPAWQQRSAAALRYLLHGL